MHRRSPKSGTPLNEKQQELALRESELREKMQKLQRVIAEAPRKAEERSRLEREVLLDRARGDSRLNVSMTLEDNRYSDAAGHTPRRGALRKAQREGRIVFLLLVIVLAAAVIWLVSHLRF